MGIIFGLLFWGLVIGFIIKCCRGKSPFQIPLQLKLLKQKKITHEQYIQIEKFEEEEKIKKWQNAGLITTEQSVSVLEKPKIKWLSVSATLIWLGLGCILIGIIAVIAANYDKIPPMVRLMTTFAFFIVSCLGFYKSWQDGKQKIMEYFIVSSIALVGALIGLIIQTFHLPSEVTNALCLWSILALPFILFSKFKYWASVWYPIFIITFLGSTYGQDLVRFLSDYNPILVFMTVTILVFDVYTLMRLIIPKHTFTKTLEIYSLIWSVIAVIFIDFLYVDKVFTSTDLAQSMPAYIVLLLTLIPSFASFQKNKLCMLYALFILCFGLIACFISLPIMGIAFTLITLSFLAVHFAKNNQLMLFNTVSVVFFIRIVLAYINLFMSLLNTGISAIILGILILTGVYWWSHKRQRLINYIQKGK